MSKRFRIAKRISMEDIDHFEDIEVDDDFVDKDMVQIIADNEYDPMYDDCESIAVALQLAGYGKVSDLEAKLAESEEDVNKLKSIIGRLTYYLDKFNYVGEHPFYNTTREQDKISFAVEQLEKVKGKIQHNILFVNRDDYVNVIEEIDNQIKQLKEK